MNNTKITVKFGCDSTGNHTSRPSRIIDTDERFFNTPQQALSFALECTECYNIDDIYKILGANSLRTPKDLMAESLLFKKG